MLIKYLNDCFFRGKNWQKKKQTGAWQSHIVGLKSCLEDTSYNVCTNPPHNYLIWNNSKIYIVILFATLWCWGDNANHSPRHCSFQLRQLLVWLLGTSEHQPCQLLRRRKQPLRRPIAHAERKRGLQPQLWQQVQHLLNLQAVLGLLLLVNDARLWVELQKFSEQNII